MPLQTERFAVFFKMLLWWYVHFFSRFYTGPNWKKITQTISDCIVTKGKTNCKGQLFIKLLKEFLILLAQKGLFLEHLSFLQGTQIYQIILYPVTFWPINSVKIILNDFCVITGRGWFNNNPSVIQFRWNRLTWFGAIMLTTYRAISELWNGTGWRTKGRFKPSKLGFTSDALHM